MANLLYSEQVDRENVLKLRQLANELPSYCKEFFRGIKPRTQSRTRIAYAYDLKVFFTFLYENNPDLKKEYENIKYIPVEVMDSLTPIDIEEYMEYLKYRTDNIHEVFNKTTGVKRKISCLKSLYK